jgi:stringent starvation protein B
MSSQKPYLIRAIYEWLVDNELTPYLMVDCNLPGVEVPPFAINEGKIVLNVAPHAVHGLMLGNDGITFSARFSGRPHSLVIPTAAVLAIYAHEDGEGMVFPPEDENLSPPPPSPPAQSPPKKPQLKVVK